MHRPTPRPRPTRMLAQRAVLGIAGRSKTAFPNGCSERFYLLERAEPTPAMRVKSTKNMR